MNSWLIWPPHLSDVATLPWQIKSFSALLFTYFRLFTLPQKKTNSNCCTAASAVYLLLFSAYYYMHSPSTASGARYSRSAYIDMDTLRLAAAACCNKGWISAQRGVLCDWSVSKKNWKHVLTSVEHLLWRYLPDIPVATHHNRFFQSHRRQPTSGSSEPPTLERTQQTFSRMKKFCNSQASVVTFSGGVGRWITVCFRQR